MKTIQIIVSGTVQGVFFRKYTAMRANELGIKGEVLNLRDGTVKIIAQADEDTLKVFIEWCHVGSPQAKVQNVIVSSINSSKNYRSFEITRY